MLHRLKQVSTTKKVLFTATGLISFCTGTYFNDKVIRKRKGLRKMAQIYLRDDLGQDSLSRKRELKNQVESGEDMEYYHASLLQYLRQQFTIPYAIIFPKRLESLQKIVKMANKYNIAIINLDEETIGDFKSSLAPSKLIEDDDKEYVNFNSDRPFILINQRKINAIEFNEVNHTIKVGVGCTVKEVNEYLEDKGYRLPVSIDEENTRIFTLLNKNECVLDGKARNIKELTCGLTVVLPDGKALITTAQEQKSSFAYGIDFANLFIGQNANFGLLVDATLKVEPINAVKEQIIPLDVSYLGPSSLYYLVTGAQTSIPKTSLSKLSLEFQPTTQYLKVVSDDKFDMRTFLNDYINPYVYRELWAQGTCLAEPPTDQMKLYFAFDQESLLRTMLNIYKLPTTQLSISADLCKNVIQFSLERAELKDLSRLRTICAYVRHNNGRFLRCDDKQVDEVLRQEAFPEEHGLNNLYLQRQIKRYLDLKNILINPTFGNADTIPTDK